MTHPSLRHPWKSDSAASWLPDGVRVGWDVSEVRAGFVTTVAGALSFAPDTPIARQCSTEWHGPRPRRGPPDRTRPARRQPQASPPRSPLRHVPDRSRQEAPHLAGVGVQADEGGEQQPRCGPGARWELAGASQCCGCCPMKETRDETVGKIFIVVRGMRRCLICDSVFTPREAANHAITLCCPPTKSEQGAAYTDPCSPFLPPIDSSSSPGQA
jgi:hypothetical protein